MRLVKTCALIGGIALGLLIPTTTSASAAQHQVYRTDGDGVWLHSHVSVSQGLQRVLPEGTSVDVHCWQLGEAVSRNPVWLRVDDGQGEGFVTDYFVNTHWQTPDDLTDQGIPNCGETPAVAPVPPSLAPAQGSAYIPAGGSLASHLLHHYLAAGGQDALVDWSHFSSDDGFVAAAQTLEAGGSRTWFARSNSDMYLALGTFTIRRDGDGCYQVYDEYDFEAALNSPNHIEHYAYVPLRLTEDLGSSQPFKTYAFGCL